MKKIHSIIILVFIVLCSVFVAAETNVIDLRDIKNWKLESNGAAPVNIQDQTTPSLDIFFVQLDGAFTTLLNDASINDIIVNVTSVADISVGTYLGISVTDRFYFGEVLSVDGNSVELDTPIDFNYSAGSNVIPTTRDLDVDGSTTSETFIIGTGGASTIEIDITRIMVNIETTGAVDLNKFGDLTRLTRGLVLRRVNGDVRNIWNVKDNGELRALCFDMNTDLASNPAQGQNGVGFRYTFAGQDKHGVAVRLEPGDTLELIIQDDLSGLDTFRVIAEGHIVTD